METVENEDWGLIKTVSAPIYRGKGWMKLTGIVSLIYGALTALSIIGIIFAWIPIWIGALLVQSANAIEQAYEEENKDSLLTSLEKLRTYFFLIGILTLLGLVVTGLMFLAAMFGSLQIGMTQFSGWH